MCFCSCAFVDRGRMYIVYYVKGVWAFIRTTRAPLMESLTMEKFPSASARLSVRLPTTTRRGNMYLNLGENEMGNNLCVRNYKHHRRWILFCKFLAFNQYFIFTGLGMEKSFCSKQRMRWVFNKQIKNILVGLGND